MNEPDWLAERFEENRTHLRSVAYRMLGSRSEAEDAVQEAWLRLSRTDANSVENLGGWLTTVVSRVCLDMLRTRKSRREEPVGVYVRDEAVSSGVGSDPENEAILADSVGPALLVILEALAPAERLAFVLHDMFGMPFDEIAPIVGRSSVAARQLASRARRRVQGADPSSQADGARRKEIVDAFLAAARNGEFDALLAMLDPDAVFRADRAALESGKVKEVSGAPDVASIFSGRAQVAQLALIEGEAGLVWAPGGKPRVAFAFTIVGEMIVAIDMIADPAHLGEMEMTIYQTDLKKGNTQSRT